VTIPSEFLPSTIVTAYNRDAALSPTMTVERRRQIESVFHQAAARPEPDRAMFLREACAGDEPLRREVETLLAAHDGAASLLETPAALFDGTISPNAKPEPLRERIGRYRVTDTLGEGGMGVVYAAVDEQLDRPIALKVLRQDTASDPVARERFWREARLAARVNHPHICQLYEIGESDGQLFIAMERLEGESLGARLRRGAVPLADAVQIGLDVLAALDALHRHGITHRDLKPSNIILTPHGAKVLDFGVAQPKSGGQSATRLPLTHPGTIVGTPQYMAPEQVMGTVVEASADLFAAGAILYEMLSGTAAFEANTIPAVMERVLHADVAVIGGSPAVAAADRVIHRALAKSPAQRYPSAAVMADDLRTVLSGHGREDSRRARVVTRLMVLPFRLLRADAEIDFLAFSLADAVASSLSSLETLVVRSAIAASRFAAELPDLAKIASEAQVDVVLSGTLLRAGDTLRVNAQLLEAPAGTVLWSHTSQVLLGDIFQLEDTLVRQIVESLALPLSGREHQTLGRDVPASAKAYEFYLRANPLSQDSGSWQVARDLYLQCVQVDPHYAPAWARLGRVYRLLGKFRPVRSTEDAARAGENLARAESAFNRALALNPELAIADSFYAQLELDLGRAQEAMVRLVRRASARSNDPDLFAALVSACRYCGLLQASFAADERTQRLDPTVRTSVTHTYFMAGEYLRAAAVSERRWQTGNLGALALLCAGHPDAAALGKAEADRYGIDDLTPALMARDRGRVRSAIDEWIPSFPDPEYHFYCALMLAHVGDCDRAVEILAGAVDGGFFPVDTFTRHAWLDSLRARPDFVAILLNAARRHNAARAGFVDAGGGTLLGLGDT
jgi:eukaryotic-like serine/threonine-protein kinase